MSEPSKYEFKVTVHPHEEPALRAELAKAVEFHKRKVYFYDTPKLKLFADGIVLRARSTDGKADSTVKLRPVPAAGIPAEWGAGRYEIDVVGAKEVGSVKLDGDPDKDADLGEKPHELFDEAQRELVPDVWADLHVLGPIHAYVWDLKYDAIPEKVSVEEWTVPGGPHFMELSFKVKPGEKAAAEEGFDTLLKRLNICRYGDPDPKTKRVLDFFAQ